MNVCFCFRKDKLFKMLKETFLQYLLIICSSLYTIVIICYGQLRKCLNPSNGCQNFEHSFHLENIKTLRAVDGRKKDL